MPTEEVTRLPGPDVMFGLLNRETLGKQLGGISDRTIVRYERAGMPFIAIGMLRRYDPAKVREWLMAHESRHDTPRRGRPSKRAA